MLFIITIFFSKMKRERSEEYWFAEYESRTDEGDVLRHDTGFFSSVDNAKKFLETYMRQVESGVPKFNAESALDDIGVNLETTFHSSPLGYFYKWKLVNIEEELDKKLK